MDMDRLEVYTGRVSVETRLLCGRWYGYQSWMKENWTSSAARETGGQELLCLPKQQTYGELQGGCRKELE